MQWFSVKRAELTFRISNFVKDEDSDVVCGKAIDVPESVAIAQSRKFSHSHTNTHVLVHLCNIIIQPRILGLRLLE